MRRVACQLDPADFAQIEIQGPNLVRLEVKQADELTVVVLQGDKLAEALQEAIPGFEAKYTEPVRVPHLVGAVVREASDALGRFAWVRVARATSTAGKEGWQRIDGTARTNDAHIALILANGGVIDSQGVSLP